MAQSRRLKKTSGIHKWRNPTTPLLPLSLSNWPSWISLPDLSRTLCVGPWILHGSCCPSTADPDTHRGLKRWAPTEPSSSLRPMSHLHLPGYPITYRHCSYIYTSINIHPINIFPTMTTSLVVFCNHCSRSATTCGQMDTYLTTF